MRLRAKVGTSLEKEKTSSFKIQGKEKNMSVELDKVKGR